MGNVVSFSNVPGNSDCSWYENCDWDDKCMDCSKPGKNCPAKLPGQGGCPKYYPYQSEVIKKPSSEASAQVGSGGGSGGGSGAAGGSGSGSGSGSDTQGDRSDTLQLLPTDKEITIRVFVDRTLVEAYWMDGRVAMTSAAKPGNPHPILT